MRKLLIGSLGSSLAVLAACWMAVPAGAAPYPQPVSYINNGILSSVAYRYNTGSNPQYFYGQFRANSTTAPYCVNIRWKRASDLLWSDYVQYAPGTGGEYSYTKWSGTSCSPGHLVRWRVPVSNDRTVLAVQVYYSNLSDEPVGGSFHCNGLPSCQTLEAKR